MTVKPRDRPKAVQRDDYSVHRRIAGKPIRVAQTFLTSVVFTGIILVNPVAVVQTVSLIFSFDWMNAVALVVIIVGGMVIELILIHIHDSQQWKEIIGYYFSVFDDCFFEPIMTDLTQKEIKIRGVLRSPEKSLFLSRFLMPSIRAFYVYPSTATGRGPLSPKAYQMAGGTSYVFLQQNPERLDSFATFKLLHEIGHTMVSNKIIYVQGWFAVVYFCLLFVFVAFHREAGILALLVTFALAAMWAHYLDLQQDNTDKRLELVADAFALVHLVGRSDFATVIDSIARLFRKVSKDVLLWHYRAELLVRRAQILSRPGTEFSLGWGQGLSWLEQVMLPVPLWLGLLILAAMLWLGTTLSIKGLEELLALSLVWVVVPGLVYYYLMFKRSVELPSTFWGRRKAVDFLQAHAPEYDIRLMSVAATEDLPDVGRNLMIVALVGADLHIRIFNASKNKVMDKTENKLIIDKTLADLKKRLFHDESSLSKEEKQRIIRPVIFNLLFS